MYICNCNGIRQSQAQSAIDMGAKVPRDVFRYCQAKAKCAKCVCDIRQMIDESQETHQTDAAYLQAGAICPKVGTVLG